MPAHPKASGIDPVLKELLDRPIAYHRAFVRLGGGVSAAVFLSQAFYWHHRSAGGDGWFYKTADEWRDETGLTKYEIREARRHWTMIGVLEENLRGVPATLHFRVNLDRLLEQLASLANVAKLDLLPKENQFDESSKTGLPHVDKTSLTNVGNRDCRASPNPPIEQRLPKTTSYTASDDAANFIVCGRGKHRRKLAGWKLIAFMRFWEAFNYKHARADAAAAWLDIPGLTPDLVDWIVEAAHAEARRRPQIEQRGGTPIYAQGWINANRFEDEALHPKAKKLAAPMSPIDEDAEKRRQTEKFNAQMASLGRRDLQVPLNH